MIPPTGERYSDQGLDSIKLTDKRTKKGVIAFLVKAKDSLITPLLDGPLRLTFVLGAGEADSLVGECRVHEFASESCTRKSDSITCK